MPRNSQREQALEELVQELFASAAQYTNLNESVWEERDGADLPTETAHMMAELKDFAMQCGLLGVQVQPPESYGYETALERRESSRARIKGTYIMRKQKG